MNAAVSKRRHGALLLPLVLLCCAAPQYDDQANAQLTALQKEVDGRIVQLISDARQGDAASLKDGSYAQNVPWYNRVDTDMTALELRMEASTDPSAAKLPQFFDNLRTELANVQKAHQAKGDLSEIVWTVTRNQLNAQFAVLMTYELSLKGTGSSASSPVTQSTATAVFGAKVGAIPGGN